MAKKPTRRVVKTNRQPLIQFRISPIEYQRSLQLRPKHDWRVQDKMKLSTPDCQEIWHMGLQALSAHKEGKPLYPPEILAKLMKKEMVDQALIDIEDLKTPKPARKKPR